MVTAVVRHRVELIKKTSIASCTQIQWLYSQEPRPRTAGETIDVVTVWSEDFAVATTKRQRKKFLARTSPDWDRRSHRLGKIFDISEFILSMLDFN